MIRSGLCVDIVMKQDQRSGRKTRGIVKEILTNSSFHPHGIKVRLSDGKVGRVAGIISVPPTADPENIRDDGSDLARSETA